ncbi:MAG TPA: translation initiation factor 2 [Candidatus Faecousia faecavium]|nr:translation initiation factor 2 [Candidatus Faecousia faecavium]
MVKGISRQVIVVHAPEPKLFEQAIFILKDDAVASGITDEALLKEAQQAIHGSERQGKRRHLYLYGAVWAAGGALLTGLVWVITLLF